MRHLTIMMVVGVFLGTLWIQLKQPGADRISQQAKSTFDSIKWAKKEEGTNNQDERPTNIKPHLAAPQFISGKSFLRAPGKIEGKTETIELRARFPEQISHIKVTKGEWVTAGQALIQLDSSRLKQEHNLAKASLAAALARKQRLENGARESEVAAAKQDYEAILTPLWSSQRAFDRGLRLYEADAFGQQELDDLKANLDSLQAQAGAAQSRLETLELPARKDERMGAVAEVRAAESRLEIARINLERAIIIAPIEGRILDVNARVGELAGPDSQLPLIAMVDTRYLHAVAEVDEFDALRVKLGQRCEITSDASDGLLAIGHIVEIEPRMNQKRFFGEWAGERNDTFSRKVRIELEDSIELPIGLPVDVAIQPLQSEPL